MPDHDEDDDSDLNDIAYISSDDDASGPGWLVGFSVVFGVIGLASLIIAISLGIVHGLFEPGGAGVNASFGWAIFTYFMMAVTVGSFGFAAGLAGFALAKARALNHQSMARIAKVLVISSIGLIFATILMGMAIVVLSLVQ